MQNEMKRRNNGKKLNEMQKGEKCELTNQMKNRR